MRLSRLLAAAFTAGGLWLAFPVNAWGNDVNAATLTCTGWTVTYTHFPTQPVPVTVLLDYPNGHRDAHIATTGPSGVLSGRSPWTGTGTAGLTVLWNVGGPHHYSVTARLDCPPPTTTTSSTTSTTSTTVPTSTTTSPPTSTVPPSSVPPTSAPPGPPAGLPPTGASGSEIAVGVTGALLVAAGLILVRGTRPVR